MSEFKISCPNCDQHIACDESYYGVQINCPTCGMLIQMPAGAGSAGRPSVGSRPPSVSPPSKLRMAQAGPPPPRGPRPTHAPGSRPASVKPKGNSWLTTFVFAWFLGGFGVDRFYNGRIGLGIGKLLTGGACGLWSLVDVLLLLFKKYQDAQGNYLRPAKRSHMVIALSIVGAGILMMIILMVSVVQQTKSAVAGFKETAQRIECMNNLKQIGLAFRQWGLDHNDQFPFNVSAAKGGTLEYCQRATDGFDANAFRHFQVLSNELATPTVLVCPGDASKEPVEDWGSLDASHVTYLLRSGTQLSGNSPNEVLARCPIHGNTLYCDGRVESSP